MDSKKKLQNTNPPKAPVPYFYGKIVFAKLLSSRMIQLIYVLV
jgi:hypothetical protein